MDEKKVGISERYMHITLKIHNVGAVRISQKENKLLRVFREHLKNILKCLFTLVMDKQVCLKTLEKLSHSYHVKSKGI